MQQPQLNRRFRILLHLLKRLDMPRAGEAPRPGAEETAAALEILARSGWLGYETMLFEVASGAIQDLECHLDSLGQPRPGEPPAWRHQMDGPWLSLDWEQAERLQALLDALVSAFLESEAVPVRARRPRQPRGLPPLQPPVQPIG